MGHAEAGHLHSCGVWYFLPPEQSASRAAADVQTEGDVACRASNEHASCSSQSVWQTSLIFKHVVLADAGPLTSDEQQMQSSKKVARHMLHSECPQWQTPCCNCPNAYLRSTQLLVVGEPMTSCC